MNSLQFQPQIPLALWLAMVLASAGALVLYGWRRPHGMAAARWLAVLTLSGAGMALVLVALLNPSWISPAPAPEGKPLVTLLVDRSASMAVRDQAGQQSRWQSAAALAAELQRELSRRFDVQTRAFAETTASLPTEELARTTPTGRATDLATAVTESLDASRVQGQAVLLLTDGVHNAAGGAASVLEAVETARAMSAPIYAKAIGGSATIADLELSLVRQQELSFIHQKVPLRALIKQRGRLAGEAELELLGAGGTVIERKNVELAADGTANMTLQVSQDRPGLHRYQLRLASLPSEATADNNISTFLLRTVDRPIRVLLLEGKPYWDAKFLLRTLAQDDALELDAVVQVSERRYLLRQLRRMLAPNGTPLDESDGKAPIVRREERTEVLRSLPDMLAAGDKLTEYQVVVLGRDAEAFLTEAVVERLRMWIARDGGALVCFRGAPVAKMNQQLARLMPVRWVPTPEFRFRPQLTDRGQDLDWIAPATAAEDQGLARLPSLAAAARPERPTPLAVVLAQSPGQAQPVVSYQPYGSGRVVAIEGAGMWRWAFLAPANQGTEPIYEQLWQSLMRWLVSGGSLAPGQDVALRTEKVSYFTDEVATATLLVREGAITGELPRIELLNDDGSLRGSFAPAPVGDEAGIYRAAFGRLPAGAYVARIAGQPPGSSEGAIALDVRENYTEQLDTAARPELLARMADVSGGAVLTDVTAADLTRRFQEHLAKSRPLRNQESTLWDRWWFLALIIGSWSAAWGLRRTRGLT